MNPLTTTNDNNDHHSDNHRRYASQQHQEIHLSRMNNDANRKLQKGSSLLSPTKKLTYTAMDLLTVIDLLGQLQRHTKACSEFVDSFTSSAGKDLYPEAPFLHEFILSLQGKDAKEIVDDHQNNNLNNDETHFDKNQNDNNNDNNSKDHNKDMKDISFNENNKIVNDYNNNNNNNNNNNSSSQHIYQTLIRLTAMATQILYTAEEYTSECMVLIQYFYQKELKEAQTKYKLFGQQYQEMNQIVGNDFKHNIQDQPIIEDINYFEKYFSSISKILNDIHQNLSYLPNEIDINFNIGLLYDLSSIEFKNFKEGVLSSSSNNIDLKQKKDNIINSKGKRETVRERMYRQIMRFRKYFDHAETIFSEILSLDFQNKIIKD